MNILLPQPVSLLKDLRLYLLITAFFKHLLLELLFPLCESCLQLRLFDLVELVYTGDICVELCFEHHDFVQQIGVLRFGDLVHFLPELLL